MSTIVSPTTVAEVTGVAVNAVEIAQARAIIEVYLSVDLTDLSRLYARDRMWASRAICYQVAWMQSQPDLFTRMDVTSMSQDGLTMALRDKHSLVLAPLARSAASRVSWKRSRTVRVSLGLASRLANQMDSDGDLDADGIARPLVAGAPYFDTDDGWEAV